LDLVDRLHLEKSYDLAIRLADRHDKLADMIEDAKDRKFGILDGDDYIDHDDDEHDNNYKENPRGGPKRTNFLNRLESQALPHITPETGHQSQKRLVGRQQSSSVPKRHKMR
jgi:hypothetical protein